MHDLVKLARKYEIQLLAAGRRHCYSTGHGKFQNDLAMDLQRLNSIELNTAAETFPIGGGVTTGELLDLLLEAGFELRERPCANLEAENLNADMTTLWGPTTGSCSATGIVGTTLGGRVGC